MLSGFDFLESYDIEYASADRERENENGNTSYCLHLWLRNVQIQHAALLLLSSFDNNDTDDIT